MPKKRQEAIIDYSDLVEDAKQTAVILLKDATPNALDLFYETNLENVETGIKKLNEYSSKCWLISAITLYTMIYDKSLYLQTNMGWEQYLSQSRNRLGLDPRDVTEQLSSARFFITNHKALLKAGWNPIGSGRKLARAELALELCGDKNEVIQHLATDSWEKFKDWYSSFKTLPATDQPPSKDAPHRDGGIPIKSVEYKRGKIFVSGVEAMTVSPQLAEEDKAKLESYIKKIAESLMAGYEPAIIPVYDKNEGATLIRLRDKNRQKK